MLIAFILPEHWPSTLAALQENIHRAKQSAGEKQDQATDDSIEHSTEWLCLKYQGREMTRQECISKEKYLKVKPKRNP